MKHLHRNLRIDWWFDERGANYRILIPDRRKTNKLPNLQKWETSAQGGLHSESRLASAIAECVKNHIEYDLHCRRISKKKRARKQPT